CKSLNDDLCSVYGSVFHCLHNHSYEVRILERHLSRTIKNELRFFAFVCSSVPKAAPNPERMNARTGGFEVLLQFHRREQDINTHISPAPLSAADVQIADWLQMIALCVLAELVGEALWGQWVFCVVLTPPLIGCIQIFG